MKKLCQVSGKHTVGGIVFYKHLFLVQFYHDLVSNLDQALNRSHKQTDVIVMDFAKAFDKVPHKRLL